MFIAVRGFPGIALMITVLSSGAADLTQAQTPSNSCARERTACLSGSVRTGMFGSKYVPPDDVARCSAAYQACLSGQQTAPPPPKPAAPSTQKKATLPPKAGTGGNVLAGVRKFSIGTMEWEINGAVATYRQVYPGAATSVVTARGTVAGNRIEGTMEWTFPGDPNCDVRHSEHFVYVFDAENVTGKNDPGPVVLRGPCRGTWDKMTRGSRFTAPWRKME